MEKATDDQRRQIETLLDSRNDMTIATNRADGWPQATVVAYANDGLTIYFGCSRKSQKAANIRADNRVSAAIAGPCPDWNDITGLSLAARAREVTHHDEIEMIGALLFDKFPQAAQFVAVEPQVRMALFRLETQVVSILDYTKGFGHAELVWL